MEAHPSTPPHDRSWELQDIPINPVVLSGNKQSSNQPSIVRSSSLSNKKFKVKPTDSTKSTIDSIEPVIPIDKASFRIRTATPRINLTKKKAGALVDIFQNIDEFIRNMIEKGEDVDSEEDLYLKLLSEYLDDDIEEIKQYKKIEIIADTTNLTLQAIGETLKELIELKLNGSIISSLRDVGTSYKNLKVLWISRVGLKDLSGLLAFQNLEELYASYNYVSDISDIEYIEKLQTLDLEANNITDIRQVSHISGKLKFLTLAGNKISEHEDYLKAILEYGKSLEFIDDVDVKSIQKDFEGGKGIISSPIKISKKPEEIIGSDDKLIERFKAFGLSEIAVRESIKLADDFLGNEPTQDEIIRQSIKCSNKSSGLKGSVNEPKITNESASLVRPATASMAEGMYKKGRIGSSMLSSELAEVLEEEERENTNVNQIEGYSELVSNTEMVFAGNPLKAAKQKKRITTEKGKAMDIYDLIDQFKGASSNLMNEINKKMRENTAKTDNKSDSESGACSGPEVVGGSVIVPGTGPVPVLAKPLEDRPAQSVVTKGMPELKRPERHKGMTIIKRIKYFKKPIQ